MHKTFCNLIRGIVEVYVDDIVVKTKVGTTLVEDLSLVFDQLRATRTKLNLEKCIFGVSAGKLLGFWSHIEASRQTQPRSRRSRR